MCRGYARRDSASYATVHGSDMVYPTGAPSRTNSSVLEVHLGWAQKLDNGDSPECLQMNVKSQSIRIRKYLRKIL